VIAITGAAGFIGSNLAHRLAAEGANLLLVDHPLTAAKAANWVGLDGFAWLDHKRFLEALSKVGKQIEAVVHLGACSSTTETRWEYLLANNVEYSRKLWSWCAVKGCPFVYASSAATYGDGSRGFSDRTPPEQLTPLNLYGKSKNEFDRFVLTEMAAERPAPPRWAGVKFFNVYGPREAHKGRMASVVWQAWRQIKAQSFVSLFRSTVPDIPDGGQQRDFVFVEDCVDHVLKLLRHPHEGGLFNSGTGAPRTFKALAEAVFSALGRAPDIRWIDMPEDLKGRYQSYTCADMGRWKELASPPARTSLEHGVAATVAWLERTHT
jgi:ADP-L-glycero-D-manno-heptose 6-epimerase